MSPRHHRAVELVFAATSVLALLGGAAHAGPALPLDFPGARPVSGDSPRACAALADRANARLQRGLITEMDVYRTMGDGYYATAVMNLAVFVPTLGLHLQRGAGAPGLTVSWPGSIPFGPATACRLSSTSGGLEWFRSLRLVIEPGIVVRSTLSAFVRPSLRAIWHRSAWRMGLGAGIGSTLAWMDGQRGAASISPELLLHLGRCCAPGYFLLSVRADRYLPRREPDSAVVSLGLVFW